MSGRMRARLIAMLRSGVSTMVAVLVLAASPCALAEEAPEESGDAPVPERTEPARTEATRVDLAIPTVQLRARARRSFGEANFSGAMPYFEEILRRHPENRSARNYLVECYRVLGFDADADALLAGARPLGAPTRVPESSAPPPTRVASTGTAPGPSWKRNPRKSNWFEVRADLMGPVIGLGLSATWQPIWLLGFSAGFGGLALPDRDENLTAVYVELQFRLLPFAITPTIAAGVLGLGGENVQRFDDRLGWLGDPEGDDAARGLGYVSFGARYDFADVPVFVDGGVGFARAAGSTPGLVLFPGFRGGVRF